MSILDVYTIATALWYLCQKDVLYTKLMFSTVLVIKEARRALLKRLLFYCCFPHPPIKVNKFHAYKIIHSVILYSYFVEFGGDIILF